MLDEFGEARLGTFFGQDIQLESALILSATGSN